MTKSLYVTAIGVAFLLTSLSASAADQTAAILKRLESLEQRSVDLEKENDRLRKQVRELQGDVASNRETATAAVSAASSSPPSVAAGAGTSDNDWHVSGEALLWFVADNNTPYLSGNAEDVVSTSSETIDNEVDAGFRIKASRNFGNGLDVTGIFTFFEGKNSDIYDGGCCQGASWGFFNGNMDLDEIDAASASRNVNVYRGDLELGKTLSFGDNFSTRFAAGLLSVSIGKDHDYMYTDGSYTQMIDYDRKFLGYGLKVGVAPTWGITDHFAISSNLALAGAAGKLEWDYRADEDNGAYHYETSSDDFRIVPITDVGISFDYNQPISDRVTLGLSAGYELNGYFNLPVYKYVDDSYEAMTATENEYLLLHGPKIGLSVEW